MLFVNVFFLEIVTKWRWFLIDNPKLTDWQIRLTISQAESTYNKPAEISFNTPNNKSHLYSPFYFDEWE